MAVVTTMPRRAIELGLAAGRLPLTAVETVTGRRDSGWLPAVAYTGFESTVLQLAGGLLRDETLAAAGRRKQAAATTLANAVEMEAEAETFEAESEQRRRRQESQARSAARAARERAEDRRQEVAEGQASRREQVARGMKQRKARAATKAEQTREGLGRRQRARRVEETRDRSEALQRQEGALESQSEALDLGEKIEESKAARRRPGSQSNDKA